MTSALNDVFCLSGEVRLKDGKLFTKELMAFNPATSVFTRTISANDGSYITLSSRGWHGRRLVWTGRRASKNGIQTSIKEEILRNNDTSFTAEYFGLKSGKWVLLTRERLQRE